MRKAGKGDIHKLLHILTKSFNDNKSANYVLKDKKDLDKLFKYSLEKGFLFGDVWINENENACAIIINPKRKKFSLPSIWLDIKLIFQVVGIINVRKVLHKETVTSNTLPKNLDYAHLWFLGVSPEHQGKGLGSILLKEIINYYRDKKEAICLETSTLKNLPFYEKEGFKVYDTKEFGFTLYFYKYQL